MMKNYIITGATAESARGLINMLAADSDKKMVLVSRSESDDLKALAKQKNILYFSGVNLCAFDKQKNQRIVQKIDDFFDTEFALVHFAGNFWEHLPFSEVSTEQARDMMNSQYLTLYSTCQALIPLMQKKGGGRIVGLGDNATYHNLPNMTSFTAAKAAVEAAIKCLAHEYAQHNIFANVLSVSSLKTKKNKKTKPLADFDKFIEPDDLALSIINLANMPKIINGSILNAYEFSWEYYNQGYFQRIKLDDNGENGGAQPFLDDRAIEERVTSSGRKTEPFRIFMPRISFTRIAVCLAFLLCMKAVVQNHAKDPKMPEAYVQPSGRTMRTNIAFYISPLKEVRDKMQNIYETDPYFSELWQEVERLDPRNMPMSHSFAMANSKSQKYNLAIFNLSQEWFRLANELEMEYYSKART